MTSHLTSPDIIFGLYLNPSATCVEAIFHLHCSCPETGTFVHKALRAMQHAHNLCDLFTCAEQFPLSFDALMLSDCIAY
jgi:hypothetical protein